MFQGTTITKTNPADFSFTIALTTAKDETSVKSPLKDYNATEGHTKNKNFNTYIVTGQSKFKLK